jgi:hypothetical protein
VQACRSASWQTHGTPLDTRIDVPPVDPCGSSAAVLQGVGRRHDTPIARRAAGCRTWSRWRSSAAAMGPCECKIKDGEIRGSHGIHWEVRGRRCIGAEKSSSGVCCGWLRRSRSDWSRAGRRRAVWPAGPARAERVLASDGVPRTSCSARAGGSRRLPRLARLADDRPRRYGSAGSRSNRPLSTV